MACQSQCGLPLCPTNDQILLANPNNWLQVFLIATTYCNSGRKCRHRSPASRSIARIKLAVIMRMSSSSLPQPPAHFSDGTQRVLCSGPPPEPRRAECALLKTCNQLYITNGVSLLQTIRYIDL